MKLVDKIAKLLALAENNSFAPEAQAARDMAATLMAKHNVALGDMIKTGSGMTKHEEVLTTKLSQKFDNMLGFRVARFNNCAMVLCEGGAKKAKFVFCGMPQDIEATLYMLDIIKQQRKTAYAEYTLSYIKRYTDVGHTEKDARRTWDADETDWRRWHNGYTMGVGFKLKELEVMAKQKVQEWGLVVVDGNAVALSWFNANVQKTHVNKWAMRSASNAGFNAGKDVSIHKGIAAATTGLQIEH
jgi:hypothetical protein